MQTWIARMATQRLSAVDQTRGIVGLVMESFAGAWQRNVTVDSPKDILAFSAVFACVTKIASDIAKLRIKLVKESDGICEEVESGSPFLPVLSKPNHYQNRIKFVEQWIISKLLYGNTYILKGYDKRPVVSQLYILDATRVTTLVADSGEVFYELNTDNLSGLPKKVTVPASEIIHDMMVSLWHPLVGVSPIYACALTATMGRRIQNNSTKFFDNMSRPSGLLIAPGSIDPETATRLKTEWEQNYGSGNLGKTAVLGNGMKYEAMVVPAQEAQLIQQLEWDVSDVARAFGVPLYKIGGPIPANTSTEVLDMQYYKECLQILIESLELCLKEGLYLPRDTYSELDLDGLMRMDTAALVAAEAEAVKGSIKAPNEARRRMNLRPLKGGDDIYMQQQNYSLSALQKRDAQDDPFSNNTPRRRASDTTDDDAANDDEFDAAALADFMVKGLQNAPSPVA